MINQWQKVDNIDTSDFVLKTKYNTDKTELEKKIPDVTDFVKKVKLIVLENKIPDIIPDNLPTKTALTAVENKIPSVGIQLETQTIILKLQKINLIIIVMTNILIQSLEN